MKREIKFRAWDKEEKQWCASEGDDNFVGIAPNGLILTERENDFPHEVEINQFTGLSDRNGKEIYEGDIISKAGAYVFWSERLACWAFDFKDAKGGEVPAYYEKERWGRDWEVIGNIYENPDLLER